MNAAMEEFASKGYDMSSIQKIITASGIPRGSFYQYFKDKFDLFVEIMVEIGRRKIVYLKPVLDRDEAYGLFDLMKELVKAGVEFGMNDPEAFQIAQGIASSKTLDIVSFIENYAKEVYERNQITEESIYNTAIQNSLKWGEIDPRYSMETIMTYTKKMLESMGEIYWHYMADKKDPHAGDQILEEMIDILQYGFRSTKQTGKEAG